MSAEITAAWLALAARAEAQVATIAAAYEAASTTRTNFIETAAAAVYVANYAATAYADTAVAAWQLATVGLPATTLGLLPPRDEQERLVRAFSTVAVLDQAMSRVDRARRVARSEPMQRGQRAYQDSLRARGVEHWRRVVRPDACDECASLAGQIASMDEEFRCHHGCRCSLAPAPAERWADRVRARQFQLRRQYVTSEGQQLRFSAGLRFA